MTVPFSVTKNTTIEYVFLTEPEVAVPPADQPDAVLAQAVMVTYFRNGVELGITAGPVYRGVCSVAIGVDDGFQRCALLHAPQTSTLAIRQAAVARLANFDISIQGEVGQEFACAGPFDGAGTRACHVRRRRPDRIVRATSMQPRTIRARPQTTVCITGTPVAASAPCGGTTVTTEVEGGDLVPPPPGFLPVATATFWMSG